MKDSLSNNYKVIVIIAVCIIVAYLSVIFMGKDNPIELDIENVIEAQTGIKVDLTP